MSDRDIALALSGGGYRAAYFHLGVFRKLNELGLLERIGLISSVSGGSIVAASYLHSILHGDSFETFFDSTTEFLEKNSLDVWALVKGALPWSPSSKNLEDAFAQLFSRDGKPTLMSMLSEGNGPTLVVNSTAVHSGRGWMFLPGGFIEEWDLGITQDVAFSRKVDRYRCDVPLAKAVAASAAFPLFSAVTLSRSEIEDVEEEDPQTRHSYYKDLPSKIYLSDGGVRDNTGLMCILAGKNPNEYQDDYYVIASDAGFPPTHLDDIPKGKMGFLQFWKSSSNIPNGRLGKFRYLMRQFDIRGNHNDVITKAFFLKSRIEHSDSSKGVAMFQIQDLAEEAEESSEEVAGLMRVSTRLKPPDWNTRQRLMVHGENLVWLRLSEYTDLVDESQMMERAVKRNPKEFVKRLKSDT